MHQAMAFALGQSGGLEANGQPLRIAGDVDFGGVEFNRSACFQRSLWWRDDPAIDQLPL